MIRDASVNSPLGHGRFLHGASTEDFTVAQKNGPGSRWEQHSGPFETLADVLCAFGGATDVYISPNRLYGSRKVSRLAALRAMFSDVDYYNVPDLAGMHPVGIL